MRISDWSSDVCSSDLVAEPQRRRDTLGLAAGDGAAEPAARGVTDEIGFGQRVGDAAHAGGADRRGYRRRDVQGKRVSVRVDTGGRRTIKNKKLMCYEKTNTVQTRLTGYQKYGR